MSVVRFRYVVKNSVTGNILCRTNKLDTALDAIKEAVKRQHPETYRTYTLSHMGKDYEPVQS